MAIQVWWHALPDSALRMQCHEREVPDVKKLKSLEAENATLKKLLAEQMMDVSTLKEMLGKNF